MVLITFRKIVFVLILLLLPAAAFPVTILLREGGKVQGDLVTQNQSTVVIQTESGKRTIYKNLILKVLYRNVGEDEEEKIRIAEEKKIATDKRDAQLREVARKQQVQQQLEDAERLKREEAQRRQAEVPVEDAIDPKKALFRSAILPGWGQFYSDRKMFGVLWPTLMAAAAVASYDKYRVYRNAMKDYGTIGNPYSETALLGGALGVTTFYTPPVLPDPISQYYFDQNYNLIHQKRVEADRDFQHYQDALYALGAIYVLNLLDAYFLAGYGRNLVKASDEKSSGMILSALPSNTGMSNLGSSGSSSTSFSETKYTFGYRFTF